MQKPLSKMKSPTPGWPVSAGWRTPQIHPSVAGPACAVAPPLSADQCDHKTESAASARAASTTFIRALDEVTTVGLRLVVIAVEPIPADRSAPTTRPEFVTHRLVASMASCSMLASTRRGALWDPCYEHCHYFTPATLRHTGARHDVSDGTEHNATFTSARDRLRRCARAIRPT